MGSMRAQLVDNLTELGEKTASDLLALRTDVSDTLQETEASQATLRLADRVAVKQLAEQMQSHLDGLSDRVQSTSANMSGRLESEVSDLRSLVTSSKVDMTSRLDDEVSDLRSLVESNADSTSADMGSMRAQLVDNLTELGEKTASDLLALRTDVSDTLQETEASQATLRLADRMAVKQLAEHMQVQLDSAGDRLQTETSSLTAQFEEQNAALRASITSSVVALKDELEANQMQAAEQADKQLRTSRALHRLQKMACRPDIKEVFEEFDVNNDGKISPEELRQGFIKIGDELDDLDLQAMMQLVDVDGDGSIEYEELQQMSKMTEKMGSMRAQLVDNLTELGEKTASDLLALRTDVSDTLQDAEAASSALRLADRVAVKQLAEHMQARLDETDDRIQSDCSKLAVELESKFEAVGEQISENAERFEVITSNLHKMVTEDIASTVQQISVRMDKEVDGLNEVVSSEISTVQGLLDSANRMFATRLDGLDEEAMKLHESLSTVPAQIADVELRVENKCANALQDRFDACTAALQRESEDLQNKIENVEARTSEVEDSIAEVVHGAIEELEQRVEDAQTEMVDVVENRADQLTDVINETVLQHAEAMHENLKTLQARVLKSEVSVFTLRLACETAASHTEAMVEDCQEAVFILDGRVESVESHNKDEEADGWNTELLLEEHAEQQRGNERLQIEVDALQTRLESLEQERGVR
eukprot:SAG31_NODE_6171_length_2138_cov_2.391859_1_plen_709_part_01